MPESSANTTQLHRWLERVRAGDASARNELLRAVGARLERLVHKMLRRFPNVRRWADTQDVLQNSLLRLLHALERIEPPSMRDFYNLAACLIRAELVDLARHFARANRHEAAPAGLSAPGAGGLEPEPPAPTEDARELERWAQFHEACAELPAEEREVVGLIFYHGWTHAEAAELVGVSARTVQRRWRSALVQLHRVLKDEQLEL
jgi:RNA polymerase sigma-70 factor (ECF subfamily)